MDFLRKCLRKDFGCHVTSYLLRDLTESPARQYETAWTYLLRNVRLRKLISLSEKNIIEFFIWLIEKGSLQANTIASYKCALDRPLRLGLTSLWTQEDFLSCLKHSFIFNRLHSRSNLNGLSINSRFIIEKVYLESNFVGCLPQTFSCCFGYCQMC